MVPAGEFLILYEKVRLLEIRYGAQARSGLKAVTCQYDTPIVLVPGKTPNSKFLLYAPRIGMLKRTSRKNLT